MVYSTYCNTSHSNTIVDERLGQANESSGFPQSSPVHFRLPMMGVNGLEQCVSTFNYTLPNRIEVKNVDSVVSARPNEVGLDIQIYGNSGILLVLYDQ